MPWINEEQKFKSHMCMSFSVEEYYLEKGFLILEHTSKHLIIVPNDVKLIIHATDNQKNRLFYGVIRKKSLCSKHIK